MKILWQKELVGNSLLSPYRLYLWEYKGKLLLFSKWSSKEEEVGRREMRSYLDRRGDTYSTSAEEQAEMLEKYGEYIPEEYRQKLREQLVMLSL